MRRTIPWLAGSFAVVFFGTPRLASAANLDWKGYTWSVTNGSMAGVAAGSSANVSVDGSGYLHLKIRKDGDTWTAAEIFTTTRLGFGTYQWQIDGAIDGLDKNVVLGLFPYGPAAGIGADGTNEIDIEYSRWGQENGPNGDWTNYPDSGKTVGELSYTFSLNGGTLSTSRFIWTKSSIEDFLLAGLQAPSSTESLLKSWKYSPKSASDVPQQALPLGMNLWCFDIPSDGKNVEIVVRDFQFLPEDENAGAGGGAGGVSSSAGGGNTAGATAVGGMTSTAGGPSLGGSSSLGGDSGVAGRAAGASASAGAGAASAGGAGANAGEASTAVSSGQGGSSVADRGGCSIHGAAPASRFGLAWLISLLVLARASRCRRADLRRQPPVSPDTLNAIAR